MFKEIYESLCVNNKSTKWESGVHRHHILPTHMGGSNHESNYTFLTVRNHQIAHWLLWKIHGKINDLRSMHMLGANLTTKQRKLVGDWCRDNKIGFFSEKYRNDINANQRRTRNSAKTQKERKIGTFDPAFRKKMCSDGGKLGGKIQKTNQIGIHDPANFKINASLGGKALIGYKAMTNGTQKKRVHPESIQDHLKRGFKFGWKFDPVSYNES